MIDWDKVRGRIDRILADAEDGVQGHEAGVAWPVDEIVLLCQYVAAKHGQEMFCHGVTEQRKPGGAYERLAVHFSPLPTRKVERAREVVDSDGYLRWRFVGRYFEWQPVEHAEWAWQRYDGPIPTPERVRIWSDLLSNPTEVTEETVHFDVETKG